MKSMEISPADLAAMAKVAKKHGVRIEHEFQGTVIRIQPALNANDMRPTNLDSLNALCDPFGTIRPPLDYKEAFTMKTLVEIGVGQKAYSSLIRWCDLSTVKKLAAKGYILAKPPGRKISDDEITLTDAGLVAWNDFLGRRHGYQAEA